MYAKLENIFIFNISVSIRNKIKALFALQHIFSVFSFFEKYLLGSKDFYGNGVYSSNKSLKETLLDFSEAFDMLLPGKLCRWSKIGIHEKYNVTKELCREQLMRCL